MDEMVLEWPATIAWYTGYIFESATIRRKGSFYQLTVTVERRGKKLYYATVTGSNIARCVENFNRGLTTRGYYKWKRSKYQK